MELWYTEEHTKNVRFSIKVDKQLVSVKSDFQRIDIFESQEFGRFLTLDGFMMLTEKDEFIYHEMITHVPMAVNPKAKKILVIGAGDGGTVRELVKYEHIERIDMVEIDKMVVDVCREYLPKTANKLDDERVHIYYEDGLKFVRSKTNEYDIVIVDSTDPFGPGEDLFTREFYGNCFNALKDDGILVNRVHNVLQASVDFFFSPYETFAVLAHFQSGNGYAAGINSLGRSDNHIFLFHEIFQSFVCCRHVGNFDVVTNAVSNDLFSFFHVNVVLHSRRHDDVGFNTPRLLTGMEFYAEFISIILNAVAAARTHFNEVINLLLSLFIHDSARN